MAAQSGHTAGALGMADIFAYLFFHRLNYRPEEPDWPDRDMLILSNGHICPVYYAALALAGYFPVKELESLRRLGSRLQGHPHREWLPGIETSSGPLGEGLAQAVGLALAEKLDRGPYSTRYFYCLLSDGELQCGSTWEAAMLAGREGFHNLIAVVDRNHIQIGGYTEELMPLEPLRAKWEAFGWQVIEVDGHNFEDLDVAFGQAQAIFSRPAVIIAHTIPGKGVGAWQRQNVWHGKPPSRDEGKQALKELNKESKVN